MLVVSFTKDALRSLQRMPTNTAQLIRRKIDQYAADPRSLAGNVKALRGEPGLYRLRVGDWRVIFTEDGRVLAILKIAPRGSAYE
jgi:mRNA interferase RelE/StbE